MPRLQAVLASLDNDTSKLVIDLSCRRKGDKWFVATDKWQTITDFELNQGTSISRFLPPLIPSSLHAPRQLSPFFLGELTTHG